MEVSKEGEMGCESGWSKWRFTSRLVGEAGKDVRYLKRVLERDGLGGMDLKKWGVQVDWVVKIGETARKWKKWSLKKWNSRGN